MKLPHILLFLLLALLPACSTFSAKLGDSRSAHILNLLAEGVKAGVLPYTL